VVEIPRAVLEAAEPQAAKVVGTTQEIAGQALPAAAQVPEVTDSQVLQHVGQVAEDVKVQGLQGPPTLTGGGVLGGSGTAQEVVERAGQAMLQAPVRKFACSTQNPVPEQPQHCWSDGQEEALQVSQGCGHFTTQSTPAATQKEAERH
jgi:hypothetical protein